MKSSKGLLLLIAASLMLLSISCRRNQPSLIDRNQPPETELWYVPADSTEYEYLVHIYWHGIDRDGRVVKYIWTKTDTIVEEEEKRWNPASRLDDYKIGHLTTKTDSIFAFTAYRNVGGIGLTKNLQAFHIAAIDNNGVIDPVPAAIEFVATIDELPQIHFSTHIDSFYHEMRFPRDPRPYNIAHLDTVGMYRDFGVSYHGTTRNKPIKALMWFPISDIQFRGANVWRPDLSDSIQFFVNNPDSMVWFKLNARKDTIPVWRHYEVLPNGIFSLAARCLDNADAESPVDAGAFTEGVAQVVINFDPDTEIYNVLNTFRRQNGEIEKVEIKFDDEIPDTVPFRSWITLSYRGWDNPGDIDTCGNDMNKCIKYQVQYIVTSVRQQSLHFDTGLLPPEGPQDTNPCGVSDSTSMNIGSAEYEIKVRSVDENGRVDGIPEIAYVNGVQKTAVIKIVGNYDPVLDSLYIVDHLGREVANGDTLKWKWSEGTKEFFIDDQGGFHWRNKLSFRIRAAGHDNPKELPGSGIKNWYYTFVSVDPPGIYKSFARAGSWVPGPTINKLNDRFEVAFITDITDPDGTAIFSNPPPWLGINYGGQNYAILYELRLKGRDTESGEEFEEEIFLRNPELREEDFVKCPPDPGVVLSTRRTENVYPTSSYGRWTREGVFRFYFQMVP